MVWYRLVWLVWFGLAENFEFDFFVTEGPTDSVTYISARSRIKTSKKFEDKYYVFSIYFKLVVMSDGNSCYSR